MASSPLDHEAAVREISKGYDLSSQLHTLLREIVPRGDGRLESACRLSKDVHQTLSTALSILKPPTSKPRDPLALEISLSTTSSSAAAGIFEHNNKPATSEMLQFRGGEENNIKHHHQSKKRDHLQSESTVTYDNSSDGHHCKSGSEKKNNNKVKLQRNHLNSWTTITCTPFNDGHQWRKYGEKKISQTKMPRCYYRCTHKDDQGCPATKQVQQKDCEDPPTFVVTYNKQHTCKNKNLITHQQFVVEPILQDPCQLTL